MQNPVLNLQLWQIANVVGLLLIIFLVVRFLRKRNNVSAIVLCLAIPLIQSCSSKYKDEDPKPSTVVSKSGGVVPPKTPSISATSDFTVPLGEVVVVGIHAATLSVSELQSLGFGDYNGFGIGSSGSGGGIGSGGGGGGGGGGAGTPSENGGGGGIPPEQVAEENPNGEVHVMRFAGTSLTHNVMVVVDNGAITEVKSYYNGLTAGGTYSQDIWTQNSVSGGIYTFTFIFHFSYTLFLEGVGEVATGRPVQGVVHYNSNTGEASITYSEPK